MRTWGKLVQHLAIGLVGIFGPAFDLSFKRLQRAQTGQIVESAPHAVAIMLIAKVQRAVPGKLCFLMKLIGKLGKQELLIPSAPGKVALFRKPEKPRQTREIARSFQFVVQKDRRNHVQMAFQAKKRGTALDAPAGMVNMPLLQSSEMG